MNQKQLMKMMAQAQKMQAGMMKLQDDLADERVEGTAADGLVRAVVTGQGELVELSISPEAVDPEDMEMLEDLIIVAVKNAVEESRRLSRERMEDLGLPGMGGLM
ncbi:MAG: YbaB/EbfC family nucleoid-associated protein [Candidatus Fermentibacteraceae bacterium]|nr:YbaB/EbfC family nucleoid-associated protein [Candidatus Fermentibacteraceae bacterium]MBN2607792.1 YbaB/EbfC family nucleoid-associated protein [Candidatus Fermentibacteraceae bacterium]